MLIFGRAFLGFGASGLLQGALAIVSFVVALEKVPAYQSIVAAAAAIGACAGPVIGGGLTDHVGWSECFPSPFLGIIWTGADLLLGWCFWM